MLVVALAIGTPLQQDNQKNSYNGTCICIHHKTNYDPSCIAQWMCWDVGLPLIFSEHFENSVCHDVLHLDKHAILTAIILNYPTNKGMPVEHIDTHFLRRGDDNVLSYSGYEN